MKRMTLFTSLIMVFSLFTATAALAGPGPAPGAGDPVGDMVMTQMQERAQINEATCQAGTPESECEPAQERTQARAEAQVRERDGDCLGTESECEPAQERDQVRDRDQVRADDGTCLGTDAECAADPEMTRTEAQNRLMERIAAAVGDSDGAEYLFAMVRWMFAHMFGPLSTLFL
jgi:hypothetical protein